MIIVTGDLHGDWGRLNALIASKRPEIILQCGDFGWWPQLEVKKPILYGLQKKWTHKGLKTGNTSVYFCDGNHEQHPVLVQDGMIHEMYDNVFHASRGSVLTLPDGRNVLFIGGAASVDKDMRTAGYDWFPEENISEVEFERCFDLDCKIDIVISHTCPNCFGVEGFLGKINDGNRFALQQILIKFKPKQWFFGHWHKEMAGVHKPTGAVWRCLDYPGHGGRWWAQI